MSKSYKKIKIKDFAEVVTGGTPSTTVKEFWDGGTIPWLPSGACQDCIISTADFFITQLGLDNSSAKIMPKGTIVIALTGATTGKLGILDIEASANQSVTGILPNSNFINKYLYYYLKSIREKILFDSYGGAQKHISQGYVKELEVLLPTVDVQEKIANILDKAQQLIDKRKEQIEKLDEFIQSVFLDMFGDPVTNSKRWRKEPLDKIATVVTGNTPSRKEESNYGDYIEWIKSDNINIPDHIVTQAEEYLSEKGYKVGRSIPANSILMTCIAGSLSCIGNVAITNREVSFNQQINGIVPINVDLYFLYMQFILSKKYIQSASTNSMKGMVSKGVLSQLEFCDPPIALQKKFGLIFKQYLDKRNLLKKSLTELENNFNSLMQRAF